MNALRRVLCVLALPWAAALCADNPALRPNPATVRDIAASGRVEHALRALDRQLEMFPGDPDLLALRPQIVAALAAANGKPTPLPVVERPAPVVGSEAVPGRSFTTDTAGLTMLWVQPGTFLMADPMGSDNDTLVTLTRGYWLGRTEVTQEQWRAVMENLPSPSQFKGADRPVERVSWVSAMEFCRKVTERERAAGRLPPGFEYTLPTEAQWEYACRAGTTGPHAGPLDELAWYDLNSGMQTHPVAQKHPNAWGFYDMHGNAAEWCADGYDAYPGGHLTDPMIGYGGPSAAMARIIRGGAWGSTAGQCRSAIRFRAMMNFAFSGTGFRVALAPLRN